MKIVLDCSYNQTMVFINFLFLCNLFVLKIKIKIKFSLKLKKKIKINKLLVSKNFH